MHCSRIDSRIGLPATLSIGLGQWSVSGRNRVPLPPAINTTGLGSPAAGSSRRSSRR